MCAISINSYDSGIGASQKEKDLSRLLYRICGSGFNCLPLTGTRTFFVTLNTIANQFGTGVWTMDVSLSNSTLPTRSLIPVFLMKIARPSLSEVDTFRQSPLMNHKTSQSLFIFGNRALSENKNYTIVSNITNN